jgi:hypothetical protein
VRLASWSGTLPLGTRTMERCSSRVCMFSIASQSPFSEQKFLKPAFRSRARQPPTPRAWCPNRSLWDALSLGSTVQELDFARTCMLLDDPAASVIYSHEIARQPATRCISLRSGSNVNRHGKETRSQQRWDLSGTIYSFNTVHSTLPEQRLAFRKGLSGLGARLMMSIGAGL